MGRAPCCDKANVKKGPWSAEEDSKLKAYFEEHGTGSNWIALPKKIGLKRCGKSCRLRWLNYLRPNIKRGEFSEEEDEIICCLYASMGTRWSIIASQLPGRTDNDIKNHWNARLRKKLFGKLNNQHTSYLAEAAKLYEVNRLEGYRPSEIKTVPYGYEIQSTAHVDEHTNIETNYPYADFYPKIVSQSFEQANSSQVYTIADTSPNTQSATFQLNLQPVFGNPMSQLDNDTSLRMPMNRTEATLNLSDNINISSASQMESSNFNTSNTSNIFHLLNSISHISYQAAPAHPLECISWIEDHDKLDCSTASSAQFPETVNSPLFPLLSCGGFTDGNYQSGWMNTLNSQNNMNLNDSEFSMDMNDYFLSQEKESMGNR